MIRLAGRPTGRLATRRLATRQHGIATVACAAIAAVSALSGCGAVAHAAPSLAMTSAYIPQPTTPGTTVAYLDIRNNGAADRLVSASTSVGGKIAFRAPAGVHAGTLIMRSELDIAIPADSTLRLNPGGEHLLITGAGPMHDGKDIVLRLTFAHAGTFSIVAVVTNAQSGGSSYFLN
jgi:copper(I)-binding protein